MYKGTFTLLNRRGKGNVEKFASYWKLEHTRAYNRSGIISFAISLESMLLSSFMIRKIANEQYYVLKSTVQHTYVTLVNIIINGDEKIKYLVHNT